MDNDLSISLLLTTMPNETYAKKIISDVLDKRLAACIKLSKIHSNFLWKGLKQYSKEIQIIFKTSNCKVLDLSDFIEKYHPYELPEIITLRVNTTLKYKKWVITETKKI